MTEPDHFEIPPWKSSEHWSQAIQSLVHVSAKNWRNLWHARNIANLIEKKLIGVDDALEALCNTTCKSCVDICCKKATVWYDFKDLLYLYLISGSLPVAQICKKSDLSCGKLTSKGCDLPRIARPFICTWYLCPDQAALCSGQKLKVIHDLPGSIIEIQRLRKELECEFIQVVR